MSIRKIQINKFKLPPGYTYSVIKEDFKSEVNYTLTARIAEIKDEESALQWLKAFQLTSYTAWRVARTFSCQGKLLIYRKDFKCHHCKRIRYRGDTTNKISHKIYRSKREDCPATIKVIVERYFNKDNHKVISDVVQRFPCRIELVNIHNHALDMAEAFKFHPGLECKKNLKCSDNAENMTKALLWPVLRSEKKLEHDINSANESSNDDDAVWELEEIFNRIKKGLKEKPDIFKPAISKMINNAKNFAHTDNDLISAMYNFGVHSRPYILHLKKEDG